MVDLIDDRYELLEVVASGGMATVWRARDSRLGRLVALKRPHPAPPDDPSMLRMDREARAAAALNHPNLVTVYDYGRDEVGPYLVMEMVEGPTLQDWAGDVTAGDAVEIGSRLAEALAGLHAAGIVHRDIKPSNVLMSERGPLLTDFGVALHPDMSTEITQPGKVVATPSYAAPEVMSGDPPTPASDVFSLAQVIHELVLGGPYPSAARQEGPPPLDDPHIDAVLRAALSPLPDERPSAATLAAGLAGSLPTLTSMPASGSTLVIDPAEPPTSPLVSSSENPTPNGRAWRWMAPLLGVIVVGFLVAAQVASNPTTPAAGVTLATVSTSSSTSVAPQTTIRPSTTTIRPSTTTAYSDSVEQARDELAAILFEPPRSDLKPNDAEDIMRKVDEAIEAALDGDEDRAMKSLEKTADKLEKSLDDESLQRARAAMDRLAGLLGLETDDDDRDDDD